MMYILGSEFAVTLGRADEFEAIAGTLLDLLQQQPGWQGGALLNSAGYPAKYAFTSVWSDRSASRAFQRSQPFKDFIRDNPAEGIATPTRPAEAYELVHQVLEPGQATAAMTVRWTIDPGKAQAFEESRKALFEARRKFGRGLVRSSLSRFLGNYSRYIVYHSALDAADLQAFFVSPEFQEWQAAQGGAQYATAPVEMDAYEVILALVPATA